MANTEKPSTTPGMVSVDKDQLREMIRAAVIKRLEEGKGKPSDKNKNFDSKGKKHQDLKKKDSKKEIENAKKRLKEAQEALARLQETSKRTSNGSRLGKEAMGGGVPGAMAPIEEGPKPVKEENPYSSEELMMYIQNSHSFMEGHVKRAIERTLARQMKLGQYNTAQAPTLWMHLVDAAAKAYVQDYGTGTELNDQLFSKQDKMRVASDLAKTFEDQIESGSSTVDAAMTNFNK